MRKLLEECDRDYEEGIELKSVHLNGVLDIMRALMCDGKETTKQNEAKAIADSIFDVSKHLFHIFERLALVEFFPIQYGFTLLFNVSLSALTTLAGGARVLHVDEGELRRLQEVQELHTQLQCALHLQHPALHPLPGQAARSTDKQPAARAARCLGAIRIEDPLRPQRYASDRREKISYSFRCVDAVFLMLRMFQKSLFNKVDTKEELFK